MLARSFMTADQLGIPEHGHAALVQLLGMLERGEIAHVETRSRHFSFVPSSREIPPRLVGLNMAFVFSETSCGSAGCLAGWARFLAKDQDLFGVETGRNDALSDLFGLGSGWRYGWLIPLHRVTVDQAAAALRNYLTTGHARWPEALAA